jgi:hypothetical protein
MRRVLLSFCLVGIECGAAMAGADVAALPAAARAALESAIIAATQRYNAAEDQRRESPQVETVGPSDAPYMLRARYRRALAEHAIAAVDVGPPPEVTIRIRAVEMERRATHATMDDLATEFSRTEWKPVPRGYLLDFRLRWTGTAWEQVGDPVAHPSLSPAGARVGAPSTLDGTVE